MNVFLQYQKYISENITNNRSQKYGTSQIIKRKTSNVDNFYDVPSDVSYL